jgi:hypothetical protein
VFLQSSLDDINNHQQPQLSISRQEKAPTYGSRYLAYPASEKEISLNPDQLEQIQRMRKFARTALPYLDQMREKGPLSF